MRHTRGITDCWLLVSKLLQRWYTLNCLVWLAADRLNAPAILHIMQRWKMMWWWDHVYFRPAFENGKNYGTMLEQLLREMIPKHKQILLAATVRFNWEAAKIVFSMVKYNAAWDGGKTLYLAARKIDERLYENIITNCADSLNMGHLVVAAGIAATHFRSLAVNTLIAIAKEWDDRKTPLLDKEAEDKHVAKRHRL